MQLASFSPSSLPSNASVKAGNGQALKPQAAQQAAFGKFSPELRQELLKIAETHNPLPNNPLPAHLPTNWPKALTYAAAGVGMATMGLFLHVGTFIVLPIIGIPIGILLHLHGLYVGGDMLLSAAPKALRQVRFPFTHLEPLKLLAQHQCVYPQLLKQEEMLNSLLEKYKLSPPKALTQPAEDGPPHLPQPEQVVQWLEAHLDTVRRGLELMEHDTAGVSQKFPHLLVANKPQGAAFIGGNYPPLTRLEKFVHKIYDFPFPVGKLLDWHFKDGPNGRIPITDVPKLVAESAYQQLGQNPELIKAYNYIRQTEPEAYPTLGKGFKDEGIKVELIF